MNVTQGTTTTAISTAGTNTKLKGFYFDVGMLGPLTYTILDGANTIISMDMSMALAPVSIMLPGHIDFNNGLIVRVTGGVGNFIVFYD